MGRFKRKELLVAVVAVLFVAGCAVPTTTWGLLPIFSSPTNQAVAVCGSSR